MRHRVYGKKLSRNKDERDVLFKNLVQNLFSYGTIHTSEAKAKAVKGLVDKVINLAKDKRTQVRLQSFLTDKSLRDRLIKEIAPKQNNRMSGYTSLVRVGTRLGDQTSMVKMSLIGAENMEPVKKDVSKADKSVSDKQKTDKSNSKRRADTAERKQKNNHPKVKRATPSRKKK